MPNNYFLFYRKLFRGIVSDEIIVAFAFSVTLLAFVGAFVFFVKSYKPNYQHEARIDVTSAEGLLASGKLYRLNVSITKITDMTKIKRVYVAIGSKESYSVECTMEDSIVLGEESRVCVDAYSFKSAEFTYNGVEYKFYVYIDESGVLNIDVSSNVVQKLYRGLKPCGLNGATVLCLVDEMLRGHIEYFYALNKPIVIVSFSNTSLNLSILTYPVDADKIGSISIGLDYLGKHYLFKLYPSKISNGRVVFTVK